MAMTELDRHLSHPGAARALARALSVSDVMVSQWRSGKKTPSPMMAVLVERETGVRRWHLRPDDWARIWPELISHPDAPAIPAETKETA